MSENNWSNYRTNYQREVIDRTLKKILFKVGKGKPYETSLGVLGDLIQFYSLTYRFIAENVKEFNLFLTQFNGLDQMAEGFNSIADFVKEFDKNLPLIEFGVSD